MATFTFEEQLTKEDFDALAEKPGVKTHFLGSYTWGEVARESNWTPYYVGARKDGEIAATALLLKKNLIKGYTYFYIPRGFTMDYSDRELLKFMTEQVDAFCRRHKSLYFKMDPDIRMHTLDADGKVTQGEENYDLILDLKKMGFKHKPLTYLFEDDQPRFTFRISTAEDYDTTAGRYGSIVKRRLRQAKANEVQVVKGTGADIPEFTRLMEMTEKRKDFFSHTGEYYQKFYDILAADDMVDLYFSKVDIPALTARLAAEKEEMEADLAVQQESNSRKAQTKVKELTKNIAARAEQLESLAQGPQDVVTISALLEVRYRDKAWFLYGGNDMNYGKFYGNFAVLDECIRKACEGPTKIMDCFGTVGKTGIDKHLDGIHDFKRHWGGEYTEFIGEFIYVENPLVYKAYKTLIPIYHKRVNKKMRKEISERAE